MITSQDIIRAIVEASGKLNAEQDELVARVANEAIDAIQHPWLTKIRIVREAMKELDGNDP